MPRERTWCNFQGRQVTATVSALLLVYGRSRSQADRARNCTSFTDSANPCCWLGFSYPCSDSLLVWGTLVIIGKWDGYFIKHLIGETRVWWELSLMTWPALALGFYTYLLYSRQAIGTSSPRDWGRHLV